jgi:LPS sulfotransferase NodH
MLERRGQSPKREAAHLAKMQEEHSAKIREAFKKIETVNLLEVSYPDLVADPAATIAKLSDFLGDRFENTPQVAAVVRPKLHRQR